MKGPEAGGEPRSTLGSTKPWVSQFGARYGQILEGARVMKSQRVNTGGESDRTHVDLFSGLGGFALAAHANGVRTVQFCEIDGRCRDFLARAWPGVPIHDDVRTLGLADAQQDGRGRGCDQSDVGGSTGAGKGEAKDGHSSTTPDCGCSSQVWLLTAGVPCQPASRAGKQRGSADDRWLWPEALRVLRLLHPTWALFENPPGIGDVGLAGILAEVEGAGYEVRVHGVPACAVGAPHRRERYWIVAHAGEARREGADAEPGADGLCAEHREGQWDDCVWLPCADGKLRRAPDDSFCLVDGLHRSVLGALGNSIVPQVAEVLIRAMIQAEEEA